MTMDDDTLTLTVAALLGELTSFTWRTEAQYTPEEVGVYYGDLPSAPDRGVGLRIYAAIDPVQALPYVRRMQLRFRGNPGDRQGATKLADEAYAALHGLARTQGLSLVARVSMAPLGPDENTRQERADSYQITLDNPEV